MSRRVFAVVLSCLLLAVAGVLVGPTAAHESEPPAVPTSAALPAPPAVERSLPCPVTRPNKDVPPDQSPPDLADYGGHGNDALWTNVWMWGEGEVPVPATHMLPDGAFGPMKWAWYTYGPGLLTIEGRRLDGTAPPLRTDVPGGYGGQGFHPTGLIFPTGGCWEVTGRVGEASLTFVTLVVPPPLGVAVGSSWERGGQTRTWAALGRADLRVCPSQGREYRSRWSGRQR